MARYDEFARVAVDTNSGIEPTKFQELLALGIPIITHLSLAVELQLKVLHFQHTGNYPRGHDIADLGSRFPESTMADLRSAYHTCYSDPAKPQFLYMTISETGHGSRDENERVGGPDTYDEAIVRVGRTYERWRYIYEEFGSTRELSLDFMPLAVLVKAINYCVGHYRGNTRVSVSDNYRTGESEGSRS
ncbi:HEPN domain-containing protein [Rubrivivax gelatinosus]|uniref:hypothetical protein n=1 Tax=Rubrivivax gelatinosus TaxID=28068 RepID=UPI00138A25AC|nr:hypothetical protein [Rubrivivax gelatinosus]MBG6082072.1 hypothetical protein [Rubrivivax gelatinosus]